MAETSEIQWTDSTFNPWIGCTKVSEGCRFCYAESEDKRRQWTPDGWGKGKERKRTSETYWKQPLLWNKKAEKEGRRHRVFCASLADLFDAEVPNSWRNELFQLIAATPFLDWQLLTKRPENILPFLKWAKAEPLNDDWSFFSKWLDGKPPRNVWLGTSVENQEQADRRILELLKVPAQVRFLSCEPLLGALDLSDMWLGSYWDASIPDPCNGRQGSFVAADMPEENGIHWVICGGESGPNARPMHPSWATSLRDQCAAAQVPFLFKQWGEYAPADMPWKSHSPEMLANNERWLNLDGGHDFHGQEVWRMCRVGKKNAGRLLDGRTWDEFPEVSP